MEITFLGTSSMVPTKERNPSSTFISYGSEGILIDCGEGTQRQMKLTGIKITKISIILITHWHGDHVLGLPGLLQSLGASEYSKKLKIFGPKGTKKYFENMSKFFIFDRKIELDIKEVSKGVIYNNEEFYIECLPLDHGVPSLGYSFVEKDKIKIDRKKLKKAGVKEGPLVGKLKEGKDIIIAGKKIKYKEVTYIEEGKKISIISDTKVCTNCYKLAESSDILISEATYSSKLEKKATEYNHLTAKQAALIASKSNSKKLILTHFSGRYKNALELEEDARNYFDNVICAEDFMKIRL